ncbi:hypothetical protein [uncultured Chitinophaga sp.]|uniref:hypothetical protein n=1 Tax=uncultured Chitinophaga sp. TaxID=339340 RepID=UPI0025DA54A7|nr:hypothetical protein [uncultured Chitinophaga sp.]
MISFYDLDCIIELNEKRQTEYLEAYHKTQDKFTYLMILYSVEAIFLMPVVESLFFSKVNCNWFFHLSFYLYGVLFLSSFIYSIRLLTPSSIYYVDKPKKFYVDLRRKYENSGYRYDEIDLKLKASYIDELEYAIGDNQAILNAKVRFYKYAYFFSILALFPYISCIVFQLNINNDPVYKVEIVENL